jgi:hypothetical protein
LVYGKFQKKNMGDVVLLCGMVYVDSPQWCDI